MSRTAVILIGTLALAILTFVCISNNASDIQADVQARTSNVLSNNRSTSWASVKTDGRNVTLTGVAPSETMRQQAIKAASEVEGVVDVDNQMTVASLASVDQSSFSFNDSANESEKAKSTPEIVQSEVIPKEEQQAQQAQDVVVPSAEPKEVGVAKQEPLADQVIKISFCEEQFNQLVSAQTITFSRNSVDIESQAKVVIYNLLQFVDVCPNSIVEVAGHTDSRGDDAYNYMLSKRRAQVVVNMLIKNGIQADKLHMEGYGETRPISDNNTKQGQANNRRIELKYLREGEE